MNDNKLYNQLVEDFERQLRRTLSKKKETFVQWMATHQNSVDCDNNRNGE
ncbi:hypothetical protein [Lentibacillus salicampi]|nr:hypothetical protein [Lentibacillus salicampi]